MAARINAEAAVEQAKLAAEAQGILTAIGLDELKRKRGADIEYRKTKDQLETSHKEIMSQIEGDKMKAMIKAVGADTISAIARSGPELQVRMMNALGIKATLITDGKNPINLFQAASGMVSTTGPSAI